MRPVARRPGASRRITHWKPSAAGTSGPLSSGGALVLSETLVRAVAARSLAGVTQLQFLTSNVSCDSKAFGLRFCGLTSRAWPSTRVARRRKTWRCVGARNGRPRGEARGQDCRCSERARAGGLRFRGRGVTLASFRRRRAGRRRAVRDWLPALPLGRCDVLPEQVPLRRRRTQAMALAQRLECAE